MKSWLKRLLIALSVLMLLICALCGAYIYQYFRGASLNRELQQLAATVPEVPPSTPAEPAPPAAPEETPTPEPPAETAPTWPASIDFAALQAVNEEIYAYLEIPGTTISYPVVQSAEDDLYYQKRAIDGSYYSGGSIYTQRYNTKTFADPHTVLYGHNMRSGGMFGLLGNFADAEFFRNHPIIRIHTAEFVYEYEIFAACLHNNEHLLANYDFADPDVFADFFGALQEDSTFGGNYTDDAFPAAGDRVLTLSTCHGSSRNLRFLVMAALRETYTVVEEDAG